MLKFPFSQEGFFFLSSPVVPETVMFREMCVNVEGSSVGGGRGCGCGAGNISLGK